MAATARCPACDGVIPFAFPPHVRALADVEQRLAELGPSRARRRGRRQRPRVAASGEELRVGEQLHHELHAHVHHTHTIVRVRSSQQLLDDADTWLQSLPDAEASTASREAASGGTGRRRSA